MNDLTKCPNCGGEADNGHDRCMPPNVYFCTKCEQEDTPNPDRSVEDFKEKLTTITGYYEQNTGIEVEEEMLKSFDEALQAEDQKREEVVEAAVEKGRWQGVMASMNTLAAHTDQIWQSTIQKDSIYKYIDDVQAEAEQKLQALTQPNNPK